MNEHLAAQSMRTEPKEGVRLGGGFFLRLRLGGGFKAGTILSCLQSMLSPSLPNPANRKLS